jgi:hypothetical protein
VINCYVFAEEDEVVMMRILVDWAGCADNCWLGGSKGMSERIGG